MQLYSVDTTEHGIFVHCFTSSLVHCFFAYHFPSNAHNQSMNLSQTSGLFLSPSPYSLLPALPPTPLFSV